MSTLKISVKEQLNFNSVVEIYDGYQKKSYMFVCDNDYVESMINTLNSPYIYKTFSFKNDEEILEVKVIKNKEEEVYKLFYVFPHRYNGIQGMISIFDHENKIVVEKNKK